MFRLSPIAVATMAAIQFASATLAQNTLPQDPRRGGGQLPAPGTQLPIVTAVDERGKDFSTASLRGSYTVLVFGCRT